MTLWRISRYADLSGEGGRRASGRWHTRGRRVVYLSDHPATCLLEMLVQVGHSGNVPLTYQWLEVDTSGLDVAEVKSLPDDWRGRPDATRAVGDGWLTGAGAPLLKVPAVVAPATFNYLLNPAHHAARGCRITASVAYPVDQRLARPAAPSAPKGGRPYSSTMSP